MRVCADGAGPINSHMAGSYQYKAQAEALQRELREAERKIAEQAVLIARLDPKALLAELPPLASQCDERMCDQVLALGTQGLGPDEIKANLGISDEAFEEWSIKHPAFRAAAARARVLAKAFWSKMVRESIARGDNRFPVASWNAMISQMFAQGAGPKGDASKLLVVDLREEVLTVPRTVRRMSTRDRVSRS